ncbi:MAG: alpha-2-macroglobulin family protein [Haliea sp.]
MKKQLPQSALKIVDRIYRDAVKTNRQPEMVRAVIYRIAISSSFEEEVNVIAITTIQEELAKSHDLAVTSLLESMLAELYWSYYRNNRWQIMERSVVAGFSETDIRLWDVNRFFSEVITLYNLSVSRADILQNIPLKLYDNILTRADGSKIYRPTLYDFLAHRALEFFSMGESGLTRPGEQYSPDHPGYLGNNNEFLGMEISTPDTMSLLFQTMKIYRDLTRFHLNDTDPRALLEITLNRLDFARSNGHGIADRDQLYLQLLEELSEKYKSHSYYTWIRFQVAEYYFRAGSDYDPENPDDERRHYFIEAYNICRDALTLHPKGEGAGDCRMLMETIKAPSLSVKVPEANPPGQPMLFLTSCKNHDKIYYRVVRVSQQRFKEMRQSDRANLPEWISGQKPLHSWSLNTNDPGDYRMHSFEYGTPVLDKGYYLLVASSDPAFPVRDQLLYAAPFQVTSIALMSRSDNSRRVTLLATDRDTGAPMANVKVVASFRTYDYQKRGWVENRYGEFLTGRDGTAVIPPPDGPQEHRSLTLLLAGPKGDTLFVDDIINIRGAAPVDEKIVYQTHLFLDRKIYRPGQTLFFKGIVIRRQGKVQSVATKQNVTIRLVDVNYKEVGRLNMTTNEYGSFQGSFVLPATGITGMMTLSTEHGSERFRMEEYKRPKFAVKINPLEGAYKPGDEVTVQGSADAYAGFAVTGASVKYRVTRQVRYPYRGYRFFPWYPEPAVEISHGEGTIGDDGLFTIKFIAIPDGKVPKERKPVFHYSIYVDITDLNGETHSATASVAVGYTMLLLAAEIPASVDKNGELVFPVEATNLNDQPLEASGTWTLYYQEPSGSLYRSRLWSKPDTWVMEEAEFRKLFPNDQYRTELTDRPVAVRLAEGTFNTGAGVNPDLTVLRRRASGNYLLVLESKDPSGDSITYERQFQLFSPADRDVPAPTFFSARALKATAEPGETVTILAGSSERNSLRYTLEYDGRVLEERWIDLRGRQQQIQIPVKESHRGGVAVHLAGVSLNREFRQTINIAVHHTNKKLDIAFSTFRDKLQPGEQEEYRVTITGSKGEKVLAELLTGMYDASLDVFAANSWSLSPFTQHRSIMAWGGYCFSSNNSTGYGNDKRSRELFRHQRRSLQFDQLNWFGFYPGYGYMFRDIMYVMEEDADGMMDAPADRPLGALKSKYSLAGGDAEEESLAVPDSVSTEAAAIPDASLVPPRTIFNETAFFFPQLKTDENGDVVFSYRIPESLTEWKLMLLAHTPDLKTGSVEKRLVTQKELMVIPNAPRFFRERDRITFTAKVTNLSDNEQECQVILKLTGGLDGKELDAACGNLAPMKLITVKPGQSGLVSWELKIPERAGAITYRVTAASATFSDGEEMTIPVLTNRMLVTESLPLWLTGKQTKSFSMEKLLNSYTSSTLMHHRLTLEYTSNPAWYAIQALPYMMEFPYECSEQVFSRYYANAMASHIANSQPRIKAVFDAWRNLTPDALMSNLEKNQELKALLLEETPWVRDAASESDRKQRVALLFDLNRMAGEMNATISKLSEQQASNGGWPWFKGGPDSWYITQHIITGFGRLTALGITGDEASHEIGRMVTEGIRYLDRRFEEHYNDLKRRLKDKPDDIHKNHLSHLTVMYMYTRSWYLDSHPLNRSTREAFEWLQKQGVRYWTSQELMMQGYLSLALNRLGERTTAQLIIKSLKERSLVSEEMGRYWRSSPGYYWYEAPIERQALLIEAFAEVAGDHVAVEEMKAWGGSSSSGSGSSARVDVGLSLAGGASSLPARESAAATAAANSAS